MDSGNLADWVSAAATSIAAIVALIVPFLMRNIDRATGKADQKEAVVQIWILIERSVVSYLEIRGASEQGNPNPNPNRARQVAVECLAIGDALRRMLNQPRLDSDLLVAGAAAISVCEGTANAATQLADDEFFAAHDIATRYHHLAQLSNSRNEIVRQRFCIVRPANQNLPVV
ncbi:hypothetical protein [Sphingopyxis sp. JAI128]|uniref:hypothetical protein n=1 Tax=Sphingopyxis sp. JAI128 TaxID=2723066 RepID=UPI00161CEBC0|nr:hypothetical protein [Sphingopyxis sp. JAI128]MBB6427202.1 hypothetical protein [Sphingopyxis sp. JAI128]